MSIAEPVAPMPERNSAAMLFTDASIARSALRKASWRLIPLIGIAYGVAYTDRVNISFAALQMNRD
jgi:ACS family tartrate transporter-like MFS transporter